MKKSVKSIFALILTVVIISVIGINTFAEAPVDGAELTAAAEAESSESAVTSANHYCDCFRSRRDFNGYGYFKVC